MLLIYHASHVYSRTIHWRKETELWILIQLRSTMPLAHDQVEGQYNDNSSCGGDITKPSNRITTLSIRQVRNIPGSASTWPAQCGSAIRQSLGVHRSSTIVTGFPQAACVRRIMSFRVSTLYFQAKVQRQQETTNVVVQTNKKDSYSKDKQEGRKTWMGTLFWAYIDTTWLTTYEICNI